MSGAFTITSLRNMQPVIALNIADTTFTWAATFTYKTDKKDSDRVGSIRVRDANLLTQDEQWSLTEFTTLYERDNYDYVAGTQLYSPTSATYYEAHLA